jgi:hypothetical protein
MPLLKETGAAGLATRQAHLSSIIIASVGALCQCASAALSVAARGHGRLATDAHGSALSDS